jgi:hypothetical protein
VLFKKRDDDVSEVLQPSHSVAHSIAVIAPDYAAPEESLQGMEDSHVSLVLHNNEFWQHLHADRHLRMVCDANMKASLAVRKANDPLCGEIHVELSA